MSTSRRLTRLAAALALVSLVAAGFSLAARLNPGTAVGRGVVQSHSALLGVRLAGRPLGLASPAAATQTSSSSVTFTDPTGDSGNAPDITTVTVSNDDSGGLVFTVNLPNRPSLGSQDVVLIGLDTDQNGSTGQGGIDYAFLVQGNEWALASWNGSSFVPVSAGTFSASYGNGVLTISGNRSDLGNTSGFNFGLGASGDNGSTFPEQAPNSGIWNYQLVIGGGTTTSTTSSTTTTSTTSTTTTTPTPPPPPPPPANVGPVRFKPKHPVAGKQFYVILGGSPDSQWQAVACKATIAGKVIPGRTVNGLNAEVTFTTLGAEGCGFKIPGTAAGKTIKGSITVASNGTRINKQFHAVILRK
jgi:hypothetical protein